MDSCVGIVKGLYGGMEMFTTLTATCNYNG